MHDPLEQAADRTAEGALRLLPLQAHGSGSHRAPAEGSRGTGAVEQLASAVERQLGAQLPDVSLHADGTAAAWADSLNARAFTIGNDIFFAAHQFAPETQSGQRLLAHELAHVAQQSAGPLRIQRQEGHHKEDEKVTLPEAQTIVIPPSLIRPAGVSDLLIAIHGDRMVALPALGVVFSLRSTPNQPPGKTPSEPLLSVPTVGKEGLVAVNIGGRRAFLLDAGGEQRIIEAHALSMLLRSLGAEGIHGITITHIHEDHVRSWAALVRAHKIRPENLIFPESFIVNKSAPGSGFATQVEEVKADPSLASLGHGPSARYHVLKASTESPYFEVVKREGNVTFRYYGLSEEFQKLQSMRLQGQKVPSPLADRASLLTVVTDNKTGVRMLYLGDLRGADLTAFQKAMGTAKYNEILSGVRVIVGFQHHMGALGEAQGAASDRAGLIDLLQRTHIRNGPVSIVVQSDESYGGRPFLNRSLIKGLNELGIDVHAALGPNSGRLGTISVDRGADILHFGEGKTELFSGQAGIRAEVRRLQRLRMLEEVMTQFGPSLPKELQHSKLAAQARADLEARLNLLVDNAINQVRSGASGRTTGTLRDPESLNELLRQIPTRYAIEEKLSARSLEQLQEVHRIAPYAAIVDQELVTARRTGRLSARGIEALWEMGYETAQLFMRSSGLPSREQRRILGQLPGAPTPMRTRAAAGGLLALQLFNEVAPIIADSQARDFDQDVARSLSDIIWWQSKNVSPDMEALIDRWTGENERTKDPKTIQKWLNSREIDCLALREIKDEHWDLFTIWASLNLRYFSDWVHFIIQSDAIRGTGQYFNDKKWEYRTGRIERTSLGIYEYFDVSEEWVHSEQLSRILNAAATAVFTDTTEALKRPAEQEGAGHNKTFFTRPDLHHPEPPFFFRGKATGRWRFKKSVDSPRLYTMVRQTRVRGFDHQHVFYSFDKRDYSKDIEDKYMVVGGADWRTYTDIYLSTNDRLMKDQYNLDVSVSLYPNITEMLLAKREDLEPA